MTDPSAHVSSSATADPTRKQKDKAEKQAMALERKKAATERRQKKNILRAHKMSMQKMPSSAPVASSSQTTPTAPPRRSPRFTGAESSSSAARRLRGRHSTMPEMGVGMVDVPEATDVDMGMEALESGMEQATLSVREEKRPVFENPDIKGKGRA